MIPDNYGSVPNDTDLQFVLKNYGTINNNKEEVSNLFIKLRNPIK